MYTVMVYLDTLKHNLSKDWNKMKNARTVVSGILTAISAVLLDCAWAGVGAMTTAPVWDLASNGGECTASPESPLVVPASAIGNYGQFTVEGTFTFGDYQDNRGIMLFDQLQSNTGWGVGVNHASGGGSPVYLYCNGEEYKAWLGFNQDYANSTHTFTLAVRDGWMVLYLDGKILRSFNNVPSSPAGIGITVGGASKSHYKTRTGGFTVKSLKVWDGSEKYYAPGEDTTPASGYRGGDGWLCEVPVNPLSGVPNVLIIGDSIGDGYSAHFKTISAGKANMYHTNLSFADPGAAGIPTAVLQSLCAIANFDVVVFNNGFHSLHWTAATVSDAEVKASYQTLANTLRGAAPGAKLHYLATTPHTGAIDPAVGHVTALGESNDVVIRLNTLAKEVMDAAEIPYIDGYTLMLGQLAQAKGDHAHWNAPAYSQLARLVFESIGLTSEWAGKWSDYSAGDTVTVEIGDAIVHDADLTTINTFASINLATADSRLVFDLTADGDVMCAITNKGVIVQRGAGAVKLHKTAADTVGCDSYYTQGGILIENGWFWAPQDMVDSKTCSFGSVEMAGEACVFVTAKGATAKADTEVDGLVGYGTVTNVTTGGTCYLRVVGRRAEPYIFYGNIVGSGFRFYNSGHQWLMGTNSSYTSSSLPAYQHYEQMIRGLCGILKFGKKGYLSSLGKYENVTLSEKGGRLLYLGDGETTDKNYSYVNGAAGDTHSYWLDGGAHGGLVFSGKWGHGTANYPAVFYLTGSNTESACEMACEWAGDSENNPTYITKQGTGIWKFSDHADRRNTGVIAVEDGVLQFTSIAEKGEVCSLGLATCLQEKYIGPYDAARDVDYAYLLGGASTRGVMEYVGTGASSVSTRPFAVTGTGEIRNSGGALAISGVKAQADGATLVLSGAATDSRLSEANNGPADEKLSLAKEGSGTWRLTGNNRLSGALSVKEGRLEVEGSRQKNYKWFKFVLRGGIDMAVNGKSYQSTISFDGVVFYDRNGKKVTTQDNMIFDSHYTSDARNEAEYGNKDDLMPGHYCWGRPTGNWAGTVYGLTADRDIDKMFVVDTGSSRVIVNTQDSKGGTTNYRIRSDAQGTAVWPIYIRLPDDIARVEAFDVVSRDTSAMGRALSNWTMYASETGNDDWTEVGSYDYDVSTMPEADAFFSDKSSYTASDRPGKGYRITYEDVSVSTLENLESVSVSGSATLVATGAVNLPDELELDAAGTSRIEGLALPETGTLRIINVTDEGELPVMFVNCANVEKLANWTLYLNGKPRPSSWTLSVSEDGRLTLHKPGMVLIVR